ncbi:hypothetical protein [Nostoc sp.]
MKSHVSGAGRLARAELAVLPNTRCNRYHPPYIPPLIQSTKFSGGLMA